MAKCGKKTEVYSRIDGYFRPVSNWNKGKKAEFKERTPTDPKDLNGQFKQHHKGKAPV